MFTNTVGLALAERLFQWSGATRHSAGPRPGDRPGVCFSGPAPTTAQRRAEAQRHEKRAAQLACFGDRAAEAARSWRSHVEKKKGFRRAWRSGSGPPCSGLVQGLKIRFGTSLFRALAGREDQVRDLPCSGLSQGLKIRLGVSLIRALARLGEQVGAFLLSSELVGLGSIARDLRIFVGIDRRGRAREVRIPPTR